MPFPEPSRNPVDPLSPSAMVGLPLDAAPIGIALTKGGAYLQTNLAFLNLFGYATESELLGRLLSDLIAPSQRDLVRGLNQERELTGSGPLDYETVGLRKDGSEFPMHVRVSMVPLAEGIGTLVFITDISERKGFEARLRESEERFRAYVEQSIDVIFTLDAQGIFTFASPAWERHFGFPASQILGQPFAPFVHADDAGPCMEYLQRVLSTGQPETSPSYRVRHADGSWCRFVANGSAMAAPSGERVFLGVAHDITKEHAAQETLLLERRNTERYLQVAQVILVALDADARITLLNRKGYSVLGYQEGGLIGQDWCQVCLPPEECEPVRGVFKRILSGDVAPVAYNENWILRKNGEQRLIAWNNAVIQDDGGRIIGILSSGEDITTRRQAEEALSESQQQLQAILDASEAGIMVLSPEGRIEFANRRMAEMFGRSLVALIGSLYSDHLHASSKQASQSLLLKAMAGEVKAASLERRYLCADGTDFWGHMSGRRLENPDGSVRAIVTVITDLTDHRLAEEQQRFLQAQLHQAQKMESLGALAGGVAHDMNNVLGAILGLASAHIEAQPPGSPTHKAFGTIIKATERGGNMLKGLLRFARQAPVEQQDLDLNSILREEVRLLERTTLSKVHLVLDLEPELRLIRADASALTHAFMNLCVNAVDAMPENGTITLRTRNLSLDWIEVQVQDTGAGMAKEILEKALDPFFTTKEVGKGTGLGLSIVYRTVKAHLGEMELQSEPGQGTRVILRFPAIKEPAQPAEPSGAYQTMPLLGSLSVLLVDDDELIRGSIQGMLEHLGHQVASAKSGEVALAMLGSGLKPDVVILDMNMPGLGGAGTLPRLRSIRPRLPVLLATGRADQTAQDLVNTHPFVTLLSKPFGMKELQAHLDPHLG